MDDFERLKQKVTRVHYVLLIVGSVLLFFLFTERVAFAFALGTALGMMNFRLHAHAIQTIVQSGAGYEEGQRGGSVLRGALAFVLRWGMIALVLGVTYIFYDLHLIPAALGLLGTYAVLICVGIMNSYGNLAEASKEFEEPKS